MTEGHPKEEVLSAFCDGDLPSTEVDKVEAHLSECERCAHVVEELNQYRLLLGELQRQNAELPVIEVERRIRRRSRGRLFREGWHITNKTTYLGAAVLLVIFAALFFFAQVSDEWRPAPGSTPEGPAYEDAGRP